MTTAVLFDLDGTLVDSLPELHAGVVDVARRFGLTEPEEEVTRRMIGKGVAVLAARLAAWWRERCGLPAGLGESEVLEALRSAWESRQGRDVRLLPGAFEGVRALRRAGIRTALVTNKIRTLTEDLLRAHALEDAFDAVLTADDVKRLKPEPDMLFEALRRLEVEPNEARMVGDSGNDALAARRAGVAVTLVETGYNEGVPLREWARAEGFEDIEPDVAALVRRLLKETQE